MSEGAGTLITKEMYEDFIKTEPDKLFPCQVRMRLRNIDSFENHSYFSKKLNGIVNCEFSQRWFNSITNCDKYGRCVRVCCGVFYSCDTCNSRMIYNQMCDHKSRISSQMSLLKARLSITERELKSTKEILKTYQISNDDELEDIKVDFRDLNIDMEDLMEKEKEKSKLSEVQIKNLNSNIKVKHNSIIKAIINQTFELEIIIIILCVCLLGYFQYEFINTNYSNNFKLLKLIIIICLCTALAIIKLGRMNVKEFKKIYNKNKKESEKGS